MGLSAKTSNLLVVLVASSCLVVNLLQSGLSSAIEDWEVIALAFWTKMIISSIEISKEECFQKSEKEKNISKVREQESFNKILDNIPSGILFCSEEGVTKTNKFWLSMQQKL